MKKSLNEYRQELLQELGIPEGNNGEIPDNTSGGIFEGTPVTTPRITPSKISERNPG